MAAYTTIDDPELYFQAKAYAGNGSTQSITLDGSEDMSPNLVWIKNRSAADSHCIFDTTRGVTKEINIDLAFPNNVEATDDDTLTSFDSDGFALGDDDNVNTNAENYVAWNWKESATSGMDIVEFTGNQTARTISHSLSAVPEFMLIKNREYGDSAHVYHVSNLATHTMEIPSTGVPNDTNVIWNDTTPTSSVFSVGDNGNINRTDSSIMVYLFAPKQGFSKFGSYVGNGNVDGQFIYLGFRPAFLMVKPTSATGAWYIYDNKRAGYNVENYQLYPHLNNAEDTTDQVDLLSNGFKWQGITGDPNTDGRTYVYMAFAEAPFVNSEGVPNNAR